LAQAQVPLLSKLPLLAFIPKATRLTKDNEVIAAWQRICFYAALVSLPTQLATPFFAVR